MKSDRNPPSEYIWIHADFFRYHKFLYGIFRRKGRAARKEEEGGNEGSIAQELREAQARGLLSALFLRRPPSLSPPPTTPMNSAETARDGGSVGDIFMKNSARTFVARNFLTSDAGKKFASNWKFRLH